MKIGVLATGGRELLVAITAGGIADLSTSLPGHPIDVAALCELGTDAMEHAKLIASGAKAFLADAADRARWRPPVLAPRKILGVGGNYASHIVEAAHLGAKAPPWPIWFNKQATSVSGPYDAILAPPDSDQLDYEGELGVVIGRRCRRATRSEALSYIAGYVVANDVSIRDWQLRAPTATAGKSYASHAPFGPYLVTPDEVGDPQDLRIRTFVNGELRQDGSTSDMIFSVVDLIVDASRMCTLEVGDVLFTGSPAGVGGLRQPPVYLRAGDVVRIEIERVGSIENTVANEGEARP